MFDPTIFENLKVAFENQLYDLDNIEGMITITNRKDIMDIAVMSREFTLQFVHVNVPDVIGEVILTASLKDLADEILEKPDSNPGCSLALRFQKRIKNVDVCKQIESIIKTIWEDELELSQTLSFQPAQNIKGYLNTIDIQFKQKINEENMQEISEFLHYILVTVHQLSEL